MVKYTRGEEAFTLKIIPKPWRLIFSRGGKETKREIDKEAARAFISLLSSDDIAQKIVERAEAE